MTIKINLGSGLKRYNGWLNVDNDPLVKPDYIVDFEKDPLPFEDNSVSAVRAHHILEHIGAGFFNLLKEIYRVCEPNAIIDIRVPHPRHDIFLNDPTHVRPITVEGMKLFSKKQNNREAIEFGSSSGLGVKFNVDFEVVEHRYLNDPFYEEIIKTNTPEQNMRLFREALNTVHEIQIRLKVIKEEKLKVI